jgi:hypothetical protein
MSGPSCSSPQRDVFVSRQQAAAVAKDVAARAGEAPKDAESAERLRALAAAGPQREAALARLSETLVRIAQGETARRGPRLRITGLELGDLAHQAAADALGDAATCAGRGRRGGIASRSWAGDRPCNT